MFASCSAVMKSPGHLHLRRGQGDFKIRRVKERGSPVIDVSAITMLIDMSTRKTGLRRTWQFNVYQNQCKW